MAEDKPKTGRRDALRTLAMASGAVGCAALAMPSVRVLVAPAAAGSAEGTWIPTVRLDGLSQHEPKRVVLVADHRDAWTLEKSVQLGAVWLMRVGEMVKAWSTTCPHLGCAIDRAPSAPGFSCPCHDSSFDPDGRRLTGPSPRDMDSLATRVHEGVVMVQFHRFRQGTPDKIAVG